MDFLIKNAVSIDCETGEEKGVSAWIENGKIKELGEHTEARGECAVIDADGAYLLPGLIDFHTHLFTRGSAFGVNGDLLLSGGVTMAVDMGTAGNLGYEAFHRLDVQPRDIKIKSFLNLSPLGQPGSGISEPLGENAVQETEIMRLVKKYRGEILGIKVRLSKEIVGDLGMEPLEHAIRLAGRLCLPVCVHTTNPPADPAEIVSRLRPGDVYSHMYHKKGMTILKEDGTVKEEFKKAQERGVYLEVGNGRMNFNFEVAETAVGDGLFPDIISSDATARTLYNAPDMRDLPYVMSKFYNMGMPLHQVIKAVTKTPAACLGLADCAASLLEGRLADLTLMRKCRTAAEFCDSDGNVRKGDTVLSPEMTMIGGRVVYLQGKSRMGR